LASLIEITANINKGCGLLCEQAVLSDDDDFAPLYQSLYPALEEQHPFNPTFIELPQQRDIPTIKSDSNGKIIYTQLNQGTSYSSFKTDKDCLGCWGHRPSEI